MKCPHCGESLPEDSQYCCWCGQKVSGAVEDAQAELVDAAVEGGDEDAFDFDSRKLCSDGTCIGVIGADGRCKECGKPYTGEPEMH